MSDLDNPIFDHERTAARRLAQMARAAAPPVTREPMSGMSHLLDRIEALHDDTIGRVLDVWSGEAKGNWRQELFLLLTTEAERYSGKLGAPPPVTEAPRTQSLEHVTELARSARQWLEQFVGVFTRATQLLVSDPKMAGVAQKDLEIESARLLDQFTQSLVEYAHVCDTRARAISGGAAPSEEDVTAQEAKRAAEFIGVTSGDTDERAEIAARDLLRDFLSGRAARRSPTTTEPRNG